MSAAALSCDTIRPALHLLRQAPGPREATVGGRAGALGLSPYHPPSAPARLLLLGDDRAVMPEQ